MIAAVAVLAALQGEAYEFEKAIRPILAAHCLACHASEGGKKAKGDLRLDRLPPDFAEEAARRSWEAVLERVEAGEMPPEDKPRLSEAERRALTAWIRARAEAAAAARRDARGRTVLRRLNRVEVENTLRDLLSIDLDVRDLLPPDSAARGFDNVGEALHVSSFSLERHLEAAERALDVAIASKPRPKLDRRRLVVPEERGFKIATERVFLRDGETALLFSASHWNAITLGQFHPPERGRYRFRIHASAVRSAGRPVAFRVDAGPMLMGTKNRLVGYFDAPPGAPAVVEFVEPLEARSTLRITPYGIATAHVVNKIGAENYDGPGLALHGIEVEGPLHEAWPPESHRALFGELPQAPAPGGRLEVVSTRPREDAERLLRGFARRAFRRPVADADLGPFLEIVDAELEDGASFEAALRVALRAALMSSRFLFLQERPGPLDDLALASRLSYFLWSTMPDEELLGLAERGELRRPDVRRRQVERLLDHPRSAAFVENFTGQWLGLRDIDFTVPSERLYPEFDDALKVAMVREAELFFAELLRGDLSLLNVVASDFSILNGRLARHYAIPGVEGWDFRRVALPPGSGRGGVLTMAAVLKVTANGTTTSPVLRGAWVLDRLLGAPAPPPPEDVGSVEPDIRGATTIREQLARHRQLPSCATCHARIDPPGFALEGFDVVGGRRDHYRSTGQGRPVTVDGRRMPYYEGPKVDPSGVLPDGRRFRDADEYKRLLLEDPDRIARALTRKLVTYATGAAPEAGDEKDVDAVLAAVRARGYGLRSLVQAIVDSRLFREK